MSSFLRRSFAGLALAAAVGFLVGPSTVLAQTDVTTGRIVGQVLDQEGQPLPGVTVEAKSKGTGLTLTQVSGSNGAYRIVNVPVGEYTVKAALSGFQAQSRVATVTIGSSISADFRLGLATVAETITVTAEAPTIETSTTQTGTTVDNNAIQSLPIVGRNFTDFVLLTPNAQRDTERGNISLGGQRGISTNVTVDGVDATNAFFGGVSGGAEGRAPIQISQEAVREFQVVQAGASAEFGRSGGGFVNVVTKGGTNEFKGSAFFYTRPSSLSANLANGTSVADSKKRNLGASIGGPIMKDKLFFFGAYEQQRQDTIIPIAQNVRDAEAILKVRDPGYPTSGPSYTQTQDADVFFGRLDFQVTDQHRLTARVNYNKYDGLNGTSSSQTRGDPTNGIEGLKSTAFVAQWNGAFSQKLINDLNFQYTREKTPRADKGLGYPEIQITGGPLLGEVSFLPIVADQYRLTIFDSLTYLTGNHVAKLGVEYNDTGMDQVFKGNWRGVFIFSAAGGRTANQNLALGNWNEYREFIGLNGLTADQAGKYDQKQRETAFFIQDQWFASPTVTITAGLRYERQDNPNDPVLDINKVLVPNSGFVLPDAKIPDANNQWSPRLSIAWSPGSDGKTVVRGSYGRYFARFPAILTAQLYTANGIQATQYTITGVGANGPAAGAVAPGWGAAWNPHRIQWLGNLPAGTRLATPGIFAIDPNFKNPVTDQFVAGAERDLLGIALGFEGQYAKTKNLERISDANLVASPNPAVDCPNLSPTSGVTCYGERVGTTTRQRRINSTYGRISYYTSDAQSKFWSLTLKARKNFSNGLRFYGSVTRASDKDDDSNERNFAGITLEDVNNPSVNYGPSARDIEWRFLANASYDFKITSWLDAFAGFLFNYQTGRPFSPTTGSDFNGDGISNTDRPTINGEHLGRGSFRFPDFYNFDVRVGIGFNLGPGRLSAFGECFNCTNTANRGISNTVWGQGQTPSATFGLVNTVTTFPRTIQLGFRYDF